MSLAIVCFSFPDEIPRKPGLAPAQQQAFAAPFTPTVQIPIQRAWQPRYPDLHARRQAHPSRLPAAQYAPQSFVLPPAPTVGRATYPDRIPPKPQRPTGGVTPNLFPTTVVTFGWKGAYPDRIYRLTFHASQQVATVRGLQSSSPPPALSWEGQFPDKIWPRTGLLPAAQQVSAQNLDPLPNAPAPDLAWRGEQPSYIWPLQGLQARFQQAWVLEPIRPVTPTLSWQGEYPDSARGRFLATAAQPFLAFQFRIIAPDLRQDWFTPGVDVVRAVRRPVGGTERPVEVPISPVVWLAERMDPPEVPFRRSWLIPGGASSPTALVTFAALPHWAPSYPDRLWERSSPAYERAWARTTPPAEAPPVVVPSLPPPLDVVVCVEPDSLVGLTPSLSPEFVRATHVADEFVVAPGIGADGVC